MNKLFACMVATAVMTFSAGDADAQYHRGGSRTAFSLSIGNGGFGPAIGPGFNRGFGGYGYGGGFNPGFNRGFGGSGFSISVGNVRPGFGGFYGGGVPVYGRPVYSRPVVPVYGGYGGGFYGRPGCRGW